MSVSSSCDTSSSLFTVIGLLYPSYFINYFSVLYRLFQSTEQLSTTNDASLFCRSLILLTPWFSIISFCRWVYLSPIFLEVISLILSRSMVHWPSDRWLFWRCFSLGYSNTRNLSTTQYATTHGNNPSKEVPFIKFWLSSFASLVLVLSVSIYFLSLLVVLLSLFPTAIGYMFQWTFFSTMRSNLYCLRDLRIHTCLHSLLVVRHYCVVQIRLDSFSIRINIVYICFVSLYQILSIENGSLSTTSY